MRLYSHDFIFFLFLFFIFTSICQFILLSKLEEMELVTDAMISHAYSSFANGLKNLTSSTDGCHRIKACLICDHLLEWNDDRHLPKIRLKALAGLFSEVKFRKHLSGGGLILHKSVYKKLKEYYCYKGEGYEEWMFSMFLLP